MKLIVLVRIRYFLNKKKRFWNTQLLSLHEPSYQRVSFVDIDYNDNENGTFLIYYINDRVRFFSF